MNTLYIDCRMGVSGVKLLGALVDILDRPEQFLRRFNELGFSGMTIGREAEALNGVTGSRVFFRRENDDPDYNEYDDELRGKGKEHRHSGGGLRRLGDIKDIIDDLPLSGRVRKNAITVYETIAAEQAKVRQKPADEVHFRRTGSRDIIASVVGICMILDELECEKIIISTVATGKGYANTSRGLLPIPIPVVEHLLEGIPCLPGAEEGEMCTVEGAALVRTFADEFADMPEMTVLRSGAGFGKNLGKSANCVKAYLGVPVITAANSAITGLEAVLYTDSSNSLVILAEQLEALGIRDVYTYPIASLRGRRGYILKCVCANSIADKAAGEILKHTSATQVMRSSVAVYEPQITEVSLKTSIGDVLIQKTTGFGLNSKKPVPEDVLRIAKENNMSYKEAYDIIIKEL